MRALIFILLLPLLFSCGETQFAKRKYTKGVYIEKHGHGLSKKEESHKEKYVVSQDENEVKKKESDSDKIEPKEAQDYLNMNTVKTEMNEINLQTLEIIPNDSISDSKNNKNPLIKNANNMIITGSTVMGLGVISISLSFISIAFPIVGAIAIIIGLTLLIVGVKQKPKKNKKELTIQDHKKIDIRATVSLVFAILGFTALGLGLILGIISWSSIIMSIFALIAVVFGLIAIIMSILNFSKWRGIKRKNRSKTIAGFILGLLSFLPGIIIGILALLSSI
jgi:protein-S-isoprenylcysteine O-methyltransferase Ste14